MRKLFLLTIAAVTFMLQANAGGFQVGLQGQRQTGMGLIGTGYLTGPSAVFFNPGGMSFLQGQYSFSLGISPIVSTVAFQYEEPSLYEAQTNNPVSLPFSLYGAGKINEKLSVGLGVYTPYGSYYGLGRRLAWKTHRSGYFPYGYLFSAYCFLQITETLGIGAGFIYAYGDVELNKGFPLQNQNGEEGQINVNGSTANYGFNAGLYFEPSKTFSLGVTYRSEIYDGSGRR
ncbi:MAG: outer membrane protein transport protein [Bacteroidales bacterium]|nr:outer membrane protein transport protein [Bacteroidales bacterium]